MGSSLDGADLHSWLWPFPHCATRQEVPLSPRLGRRTVPEPVKGLESTPTLLSLPVSRGQGLFNSQQLSSCLC